MFGVNTKTVFFMQRDVLFATLFDKVVLQMAMERRFLHLETCGCKSVYQFFVRRLTRCQSNPNRGNIVKKVLFGTTALAAAMTAGVAAADSHAGPKVDVNLTFVNSLNIQDSAVQNVHDTFMEEYVEFKLSGSSQVEAFGGLEVGGQIEIRPTNAGTNATTVTADEQWAYVSGSFGQVYFGQTDSAAEKAQSHMRGGSMGGLFGTGGVTGALGGPTNNQLVQDMGLGGAAYYPTTNMDTVSSDHTEDSAKANGITANRPLDLRGVTSLLIQSNLASSKSIRATGVGGSTNTFLADIKVDVPYGSTIYHENNNPLDIITVKGLPDNISMELRNRNNILLDNNDFDYRIAILVNYNE